MGNETLVMCVDCTPTVALQRLKTVAHKLNVWPHKLMLITTNASRDAMWHAFVENDGLKSLSTELKRPTLALIHDHIAEAVVLKETADVFVDTLDESDSIELSLDTVSSPIISLYQHLVLSRLLGIASPSNHITLIDIKNGELRKAVQNIALFFSQQQDSVFLAAENVITQVNNSTPLLSCDKWLHLPYKKLTYNDIELALEPTSESINLIIDATKKRLICSGVVIELSDANFAFYLMLAEDIQAGKQGIYCPSRNAVGDQQLALKYLHILLKLQGHTLSFSRLPAALSYCEQHCYHIREDMLKSLESGFKYSAFNARKNEISRTFKARLPAYLQPYFLITSMGKVRRQHSRKLVNVWGLRLSSQWISVRY